MQTNHKHLNSKVENCHSKPQPISSDKRFVDEFKLKLRNRSAVLKDLGESDTNSNDMNTNIITAVIEGTKGIEFWKLILKPV